MAQVDWADAALAGVEEIRDFIAPNNPAAATRVAAELVEIGDSLQLMPFRGVPIVGGGRKLIKHPYVIFYRVTADGGHITITAVIDGRRAGYNR